MLMMREDGLHMLKPVLVAVTVVAVHIEEVVLVICVHRRARGIAVVDDVKGRCGWRLVHFVVLLGQVYETRWWAG